MSTDISMPTPASFFKKIASFSNDLKQWKLDSAKFYKNILPFLKVAGDTAESFRNPDIFLTISTFTQTFSYCHKF